ncbi:hypothetical protein SALBM311S_07802 [Streptomyces alboniger]
MPASAVGAEVLEEPCLEQGRCLGAMPDLAQLPRVQRQGHVAFGQRQTWSREACGELGRWDGAAALGPGRVGGEYGGSDGQPMQREGAAQLG